MAILLTFVSIGAYWRVPGTGETNVLLEDLNSSLTRNLERLLAWRSGGIVLRRYNVSREKRDDTNQEIVNHSAVAKEDYKGIR